jgi:hypothetical protein
MLFVIVFNLYKNRTNTTNKREGFSLYPEAGPVQETPTVPFSTVDMLRVAHIIRK